MSHPYTHDRKIIKQQDSESALVDAIANLLICYGVGNDGEERDRLLNEAYDKARNSAQRHYDAEREGNSDGYHVLVDRQDGSPLIDLKETPA